jgi:hypothetical protein
MRLARQRLVLRAARAARASRQSCSTLLQVGYAPLEEFVFLTRLTMSGPLRELESKPLQFIPNRPGHTLARRVLGAHLPSRLQGELKVFHLDMNTCFVRNRCNVVESRRGNSGRLELGGGGARDGKKTTHEAQPMSCTHGETSIPETGC